MVKNNNKKNMKLTQSFYFSPQTSIVSVCFPFSVYKKQLYQKYWQKYLTIYDQKGCNPVTYVLASHFGKIIFIYF